MNSRWREVKTAKNHPGASVVHTGDFLRPLFHIRILIFPFFGGILVTFVKSFCEKERFVKVASLPIWVLLAELFITF